MKSIGSGFLRLLGALLQNLVNIINILLIFMTTVPDRLQRCLKNAVQELLDLHVAKTAAAVVILELIQICIVRKKLFKMLRLNKGIQIRKDRIAFDLSGILDPEMIRIREHAHDLLLDVIRLLGQVDAVAERLAHLLLAVCSGKAHGCLILRKQNLGLHKDLTVVRMIEAADDFSRLLNHRLLILACRNRGRLERRDVRCLRNRIGEEADRNAAAEAAHAKLRFHRRVSLKSCNRHQIGIIEGQLRQLRDLRLNQNRRLLRINSRRQIIQRYIDDVLANLLRIVRIVRQRLCVRDHDVDFVVIAAVLQLHSAAQRSYIMSDVKTSRRTVTG